MRDDDWVNLYGVGGAYPFLSRDEALGDDLGFPTSERDAASDVIQYPLEIMEEETQEDRASGLRTQSKDES